MVFITIVTGAYKPTYILGASHCNYSTSLSWGVNVTMSCGNQGCDCGAVGAVGIALLLRTCWARPGLQHPNRLGGNFGQIKRHISPFNPTLWLSFTHKKAWSKPVSDRNQSFPEWKPWFKKKTKSWTDIQWIFGFQATVCCLHFFCLRARRTRRTEGWHWWCLQGKRKWWLHQQKWEFIQE